jgi:L-lactate dehydrogenase
MKVTIIGGAGRVGSNAAFALQLVGAVREVVLVDVMQEAAEGEALDLRHGAALAGPRRFRAGGYGEVTGSDIVIITAGLRRKPDESRLELIGRNVSLFRSLLDEIQRIELADGAILLVVANPVDILTAIAVAESGFPPERVVGTGTLLDTTRFRSFLAEYFGVDPRHVNALILGEHGDSMVPIWSTAAVNGVPLARLPGYDEARVRQIFEDTRKSGAEVIRLKGGAGYAIGVVIAELVNVIARDAMAELPVSTAPRGAYGIRDVCLSLPTVVGRAGVINVIEMKLWEEEKDKLLNSARILRQTLDEVLAQRSAATERTSPK